MEYAENKSEAKVFNSDNPSHPSELWKSHQSKKLKVKRKVIHQTHGLGDTSGKVEQGECLYYKLQTNTARGRAKGLIIIAIITSTANIISTLNDNCI